MQNIREQEKTLSKFLIGEHNVHIIAYQYNEIFAMNRCSESKEVSNE